MTVYEVPLGVPDTRWEGGSLKPFVLPERKDHTAVAWGFLQCFNKIVNKMVAVHNPAIGGADGVSEVGLRLSGVVFCKNLVDVTPLISAICGDFPFVPYLNTSLFQPSYVIRGGLINPEKF